MTCILFHRWGKWKRLAIDIPEQRISKNFVLRGCTELWQQRVCIDCGKLQREKLCGDYHGSAVPD